MRNNNVPFPCPHCNEVLVPLEFEKHCNVRHQLDDEKCCVWCLGNTVWFRGERDVAHLLKCFKDFTKSRARETLSFPRSEVPTLMDLTPMCEADTYFDKYSPIPEMPALPVWPPTLSSPTAAVPYRDASLNLAVSCLHLYLSLWKKTEWCHVMVTPVAYLPLLQALDDGKSRTLPFFCYCDGGGGAAKVHRHMIVVSESSVAKRVWKKIECPKKNLHVRKETIESPMQLVNLLGHFSQRKSKCSFTFENPLEVQGATDRHFYVALSLPPLYRLVLAAQWDGGLLEFVNQEYSVVDPSLLVPWAEKYHGVWGIRISNLPDLGKNIVLPVQKNYRPVSKPTDKYVCLLKGQKLYFEETNEEEEEEEEEEEDDWVMDQAHRGNLFFDCIGREIWIPTPLQQKFINSAKPLKDQILDLESKLSRANDELDEYKYDQDYLRDENRQLKRRMKESEEELKRLQKKHIKVLERENEVLRLELKNQK